MSKACPECGKINDFKARICTCGYWFINPNRGIQTGEFGEARRAKLLKKIKKYCVLSAFVIIVAGVWAAGSGIFSFPWISEESEKSDFRTEQKAANPSANLTNDGAKNTFDGQVTEIINGETIRIVGKNNQEYKIVLGGIDAPALNEAFGNESKDNLSGLIMGKPVLIIIQRADEEGNKIGKVIFEGKNINLEQVKSGMARAKNDAAEQSEFDRKIYGDAETVAQNDRLGVWSSQTVVAQVENSEIPSVKQEIAVNNFKASKAPNSVLISGNENPATKSTPLNQPTVNNQVSNSVTPGIKNSETPIIEAKPVETLRAATARCLDGTLSYSTTRQGSCSRHGGVAEWLNGSGTTLTQTQTLPTTNKTYLRGSRGGCYYINANGNKSYVDRSLCS